MISDDNRRELHCHSGEQIYSDDGVDLTLIRWMLSLTPAERLKVLQENVWSLMRLRGEQTKD